MDHYYHNLDQLLSMVLLKVFFLLYILIPFLLLDDYIHWVAFVFQYHLKIDINNYDLLIFYFNFYSRKNSLMLFALAMYYFQI